MINQLVGLISVGHGMVGKLKTMLLNPPPFIFILKNIIIRTRYFLFHDWSRSLGQWFACQRETADVYRDQV